MSMRDEFRRQGINLLFDLIRQGFQRLFNRRKPKPTPVAFFKEHEIKGMNYDGPIHVSEGQVLTEEERLSLKRARDRAAVAGQAQSHNDRMYR